MTNVKVIIDVPRKYGERLSAHLQKEHPKTKGKIKLKGY